MKYIFKALNIYNLLQKNLTLLHRYTYTFNVIFLY